VSHDEYREVLALHALGALEPAEAAPLEEHVRSCSMCAGELRDLRDTTAELTWAARPEPPPTGLRRRILDAAPAVSRWPRRFVTNRRSALKVAGGLAAAAAVVLLVISQINLLARLDRAMQSLDRMAEVGRFVTSPEVQMIPLWGKDADLAHAKLAYDRRTGRAMLFSAQLRPPPEGKAYQLWVISERIRPAGMFLHDSFGGMMVPGAATPGGDDMFVFAVTLETAPGAEEPTGAMVLLSPRNVPIDGYRGLAVQGRGSENSRTGRVLR
jgi:anti-sigma-K factor RskA